MHFDQGDHSEVQHQLLITLVHGTWPRGLLIAWLKRWIRRLMRRNPHRFWFEKDSPFLVRLSAELGNIPHKIKALPWGGANSIFRRDKIALELARDLSAEHAEHPRATQLIIAHSHGGNIALRALHHLKQRDASRSCETESANPLIVTLATPFIEVQEADFGRRPVYIRVALIMFIMGPLLTFLLASIGDAYFPQHPWLESLIATTIMFVFGCWWIFWRAPARRNKLDALKNATRLGELVSAQRLLVIRAIDDEAALTMALGAILNYGTARSIAFVIRLYVYFGPIAVAAAWLSAPVYVFGPLLVGSMALTIILFPMLLLSRSVHGRELARSPMECQINTQSTPDAVGLSKIVTLVSQTHVKSLRHGIYDHEDCAKTISDWVRFRL